uniref:Cation/H+ exchanger domain-containing protein n=1 Tax=Plectus sambesii TaxID=2011161 RepID=A0A914WIC5_9BILA
MTKVAMRKVLWVVLWTATMCAAEESTADKQEEAAGDLEKAAENKALALHRLDSLSLLVYTLLLVVAVLTVWLFKHRRFRFIHESGLTLFYVTVLAIFSDMGVESDMFALVFGESVLNDAVAIILAGTIDQYIPSAQSENLTFDIPALLSAIIRFFTILFGSFTLGAVVGCSSALLTKFTKIADYPLLETSLFLLLSYVSFLLAEFVEMTGIVAVLFCGICQAHYTYNNMSEESQLRTKQFFEVLNFLSESFIFSYIGVSMFVSHSLNWDFAFVIAALAVIVIARAAHVYPLSLLLNVKRRPKIPRNHQHMMLFSGLRGAIAFALAIRNTSTSQRQIIYTSTSVIVIVTVIINGGLTAWMIDLLRIRHGTDGAQDIPPQFQLDNEDTRSSVESEQVQSGMNPWDKSFLPRKWYNFDANFMKPLLTHATPTLMDTMPAFCMPLARMLTTTEQMTLSAGRNQRTNSAQEASAMDDRIMENPLSRGHIV